MDNDEDFCNLLHVVESITADNDVISLLKRRFSQANVHYLKCDKFRNLVIDAASKIQSSPGSSFVFINEVEKYLKNVKQQWIRKHERSEQERQKDIQKAMAEKPSTSTCSKDNTKGSNNNTGNQRKLETLMEKLHKEIQKLDEAELSVDDLNADSAYTLKDRLEAKLMRVYKKLCKLRGESFKTGRLLERKFTYKGSGNADLDRKISRFVNCSDCFPDYSEIRELVSKYNIKFGLKLGRQLEQKARDIFLVVGNNLQKRRLLDYSRDFGRSVTDRLRVNDDPAEYDEVLKASLERNSNLAKRSMDAVFQKFCDKQETDGDIEADEDNNKAEISAGDDNVGEDGEVEDYREKDVVDDENCTSDLESDLDLLPQHPETRVLVCKRRKRRKLRTPSKIRLEKLILKMHESHGSCVTDMTRSCTQAKYTEQSFTVTNCCSISDSNRVGNEFDQKPAIDDLSRDASFGFSPSGDISTPVEDAHASRNNTSMSSGNNYTQLTLVSLSEVGDGTPLTLPASDDVSIVSDSQPLTPSSPPHSVGSTASSPLSPHLSYEEWNNQHSELDNLCDTPTRKDDVKLAVAAGYAGHQSRVLVADTSSDSSAELSADASATIVLQSSQTNHIGVSGKFVPSIISEDGGSETTIGNLKRFASALATNAAIRDDVSDSESDVSTSLLVQSPRQQLSTALTLDSSRSSPDKENSTTVCCISIHDDSKDDVTFRGDSSGDESDVSASLLLSSTQHVTTSITKRTVDLATTSDRVTVNVEETVPPVGEKRNKTAGMKRPRESMVEDITSNESDIYVLENDVVCLGKKVKMENTLETLCKNVKHLAKVAQNAAQKCRSNDRRRHLPTTEPCTFQSSFKKQKSITSYTSSNRPCTTRNEQPNANNCGDDIIILD